MSYLKRLPKRSPTCPRIFDTTRWDTLYITIKKIFRRGRGGDPLGNTELVTKFVDGVLHPTSSVVRYDPDPDPTLTPIIGRPGEHGPGRRL